ncbi:hypothetical protein R1flu_012731 [Riccia fluitans]|uniref:Uncharacterized protein n=1 Tax=Riccia fluitans TaxID=41844 RepID=A0ABD1ZCK8_9MARC
MAEGKRSVILEFIPALSQEHRRVQNVLRLGGFCVLGWIRINWPCSDAISSLSRRFTGMKAGSTWPRTFGLLAWSTCLKWTYGKGSTVVYEEDIVFSFGVACMEGDFWGGFKSQYARYFPLVGRIIYLISAGDPDVSC